MMLTFFTLFFERYKNSIILLFFAIFLILGLFIYKDYGISWDEETSRIDNGIVVYNYIYYHNKDALLNGSEKYHGPAFEVVLIIIEKLFNITDSRDVYLMRHLTTFLVFYLSVLVFFLLCKRYFKSWKVALLGCAFLVLSPRIFADSFFNSKDLVFLSFFIFSFYTLVLFHQRQTFSTAFLHAIACGFLIGIRILGITVPLLTLLLLLTDCLIAWFRKQSFPVKPFAVLAYFLLIIGFTILFWPVLWEGPFKHFLLAFKEMKRFPWTGTVLYQGQSIPATQLPWHYIPVWVSITTPLLYLVLFFIGILKFSFELFRQPVDFYLREKILVIAIASAFIPVVSVIALHSVVYDGWRHLFYIYPAMLIVVLKGWLALRDTITTLLKKVSIAFTDTRLYLLTFIFLLPIVYQMIKLHPHENIYFNSLAGRSMQDIKQHFEMDYWGLSYRKGLEYIVQHDSSTVISIFPANFPGFLNFKILPETQQKRLKLEKKLEQADYFITSYRWHKEPYDYPNEVYSIEIDGAKIMSVFKLKPVKGK